MFGKRHTEFALSLFCRSAVKVLNEQGFKDAPSEEQLYGLIMQDVFGDEEISSPPKSIPRDDVAKKVEVPEVVQEVEVPVAETPKKITNLSSKELKKNPLKITKKNVNEDGTEVEVEVEIPIPYLSEIDYSETCQSLKVNGGLFTPCLTRPAKDSTFCKTCAKANHKYGTMEQRSSCAMLCYEDPSGKKEISFGTWLKKRGVERAEVEPKLEEKYGITLPEEYWSIDKSKASRAVKKTVSTSSDDEASVDGVKAALKAEVSSETDEASVESDKPAPKKRGRPAKKVKAEKASSETDEASVESEKPASKKRGRPAKKVKADKASSQTDEVSSEPDTQVEAEPAAELVEEPVTDDEATQMDEQPPVQESVQEPVQDAVSVEKKNGSVKKLDADHLLVFWDDNTYVIDLEDNCVWSHDDKYEIVTCVGEWDPETKKVSLDED